VLQNAIDSLPPTDGGEADKQGHGKIFIARREYTVNSLITLTGGTEIVGATVDHHRQEVNNDVQAPGTRLSVTSNAGSCFVRLNVDSEGIRTPRLRHLKITGPGYISGTYAINGNAWDLLRVVDVYAGYFETCVRYQ
jgi:hypothetical protein